MKKTSLALFCVLISIAGFAQLCNPSFTATPQPFPYLIVNFSNTTSFTAPTPSAPNSFVYASYTMNYGDNTGTGNFSAYHTYAAQGTYTVVMTMKVVDTNYLTHATQILCTNTFSQQVTVNYPPCTISTGFVHNGGDSYTFTATNPANTPGLTYTWNFGDGSGNVVGNPVTHNYTFSGSFPVTVTATGAGCNSYDSTNVSHFNGNVNCAQAVTDFFYYQNPSVTYFYNTSTYIPNVVLEATWDYGDGSPLVTTTLNQGHTYAYGGNYIVTLINKWKSANNATTYCTDTIVKTVTITGPAQPNKISGYINFDTAILATPYDSVSFKVWLIQATYDSVLSSYSLSAVDSLMLINAFDYIPASRLYQFNNKPSGTYYVKAAVAPGAYNPGYIPTYHLTTATWSTATAINHTNGISVNKNITMLTGTPTSGPGFIGGNVSQGANKGTAGNIANLLILLRDASNKVIASAYTDVNGNYSFGSVAYGTYSVYPEEMNYATTPSNAMTIGGGVLSFNGVDFEKNSTSIVPKTTSIKDVANNVFSIFPNPTKGQVNIHWKNGVSGNAQIIISDLSGRTVYNKDAATNASTQINLNNLNQGVYFIKINTGKGQYTERVILQ
jgi:hypothetical protein